MSRRELREHIFKFLFRIEFNDREEMPEQEQFFFEMLKMEAQEERTHKVKDEDAAYISTKSNKIIEKLDELDAMINKQAKDGRRREWARLISRSFGLPSMRLYLTRMSRQGLRSMRQSNWRSVLVRRSPQVLSMGFWQNLRLLRNTSAFGLPVHAEVHL